MTKANKDEALTISEADAVTVVMPAYNEEHGIGYTLSRIRGALASASVDHHLLVVDDGSKDQTAAIAAAHGAQVVRHDRNRGYGASLKTGILAAQTDLVVIIDADGTYPARAIPELIARAREADLVIGARVNGNARIPLIRRPGKRILRGLAEYITGEQILDLNSGMRVFRRSQVVPYFGILPDKFSFTTTQTMAMLCDRYRVVFLPIEYYKRVGKSKIVAWDFVSFVSLVLRLSMLFNPLKIFVPAALACMGVAVAKFTYDVWVGLQRGGFWSLVTSPSISNSTLMFVLAGLQILLVGMMSDGLSRKIGQHMPAVPSNRNEGRAADTADHVLTRRAS